MRHTRFFNKPALWGVFKESWILRGIMWIFTWLQRFVWKSMETYNLPNKFHTIVVGTGIVESIVAACVVSLYYITWTISALSRCGKSVLHVDKNEFYGGSNASYPANDFLDLFENQPAKSIVLIVFIVFHNLTSSWASFWSWWKYDSNISRK
jgi:hypothetical protein